MKQVFICTIQVAIAADSEGDACDAMTAIFTENLMQEKTILDWEYKANGDSYSTPVPAGEFDLDAVEEGDIFNAYGNR